MLWNTDSAVKWTYIVTVFTEESVYSGFNCGIVNINCVLMCTETEDSVFILKELLT